MCKAFPGHLWGLAPPLGLQGWVRLLLGFVLGLGSVSRDQDLGLVVEVGEGMWERLRGVRRSGDMSIMRFRMHVFCT